MLLMKKTRFFHKTEQLNANAKYTVEGLRTADNAKYQKAG